MNFAERPAAPIFSVDRNNNLTTSYWHWSGEITEAECHLDIWKCQN